MADTFEDIRTSGRLLYEYIRGSELYGTQLYDEEGTCLSDIDTGGVYIASQDTIYGLGYEFKDMVADKKSDNTWYEISKFLRNLSKGNPNIIESLFVPDDKILYKHPIMDKIINNRNMFITKKHILSGIGMATSQIYKARGLKKKIVNPVTTRKTIIDFCYTPYNQGTTPLKHWLSYRNMKQEYCGVVNLPNMPCSHAVYYDWKRHFEETPIDEIFNNSTNTIKYDEAVSTLKALNNGTMPTYADAQNNLEIAEWLNNLDKIRNFNLLSFIIKTYNLSSIYAFQEEWINLDYEPFHGIMDPSGESNDIRLSSIPKNVNIPVCYITFNKNDYSQHCREYKEYQEWLVNRNQVRYESNLHKNYDAKNMMHAFRLLHMCIEVLEGKGFNIDRRNIDRGFLLNIRNHQFEYDELISTCEALKKRVNTALEKSDLPDEIDHKWLNNLCVEIRKDFYRGAT